MLVCFLFCFHFDLLVLAAECANQLPFQLRFFGLLRSEVDLSLYLHIYWTTNAVYIMLDVMLSYHLLFDSTSVIVRCIHLTCMGNLHAVVLQSSLQTCNAGGTRVWGPCANSLPQKKITTVVDCASLIKLRLLLSLITWEGGL